MDKLVDSSNRSFMDYFNFALVFFGLLLVATAVVLVSPGLAFFGAVVILLPLLYFLTRE